jgi:hypothetical protein
LGAPLPLSEVVYRLWRLEPWSLGRPARYAVCYVRAREIGDRFDTTVVVDGRPIRVRLFSRIERQRQARTSAMVIAGALGAGLLVLGSLSSAVSTRAEAALKLAAAQQTVAVRLRQAETLDRLKDQTRALIAVHVRGQGLNDFLSDLAWASTTKNPSAHIDALHWERGLMGVQVRGDTPPFGQTDRAVIKADKPVRPGVWLWGVGPSGQVHATHPPLASSTGGAEP